MLILMTHEAEERDVGKLTWRIMLKPKLTHPFLMGVKNAARASLQRVREAYLVHLIFYSQTP